MVDPRNAEVDALLGADRPVVDPSTTDLPGLRERWALIDPTPVLVGSRVDGVDHSFGGLDVRTLLRGEQSGGRFTVHSVVLPPGGALPAHYLRDTHTYVLVERGGVRLGIGATVMDVGPQGFGYAPALTHLSLVNHEDQSATVVLVHGPAGVERAFAAAHQGQEGWREALAVFGFEFGDERLPNDDRTNDEVDEVDVRFAGAAGELEALRDAMAGRPALPRLVASSPSDAGADAAGAGATRRTQLLRGDESAGHAMLNLLAGQPGFGAPAHHQPTEDEMFFIQSGELHMKCGSAEADLAASAFAYCPRDCTHAFDNRADAETRFVTLNSPAGHEVTMAAVRRLKEAGAPSEELHALSRAGGFVFHSPEAL